MGTQTAPHLACRSVHAKWKTLLREKLPVVEAQPLFPGVPVIGLPVATGYGVGGRGEAALGTMLQTCAPGLAVVNVDNGIGAGSVAALIANRAAAGRGD